MSSQLRPFPKKLSELFSSDSNERLLSEISELRKEIAELRRELYPTRSTILTGREVFSVLREFKASYNGPFRMDQNDLC